MHNLLKHRSTTEKIFFPLSVKTKKGKDAYNGYSFKIPLPQSFTSHPPLSLGLALFSFDSPE